MSNSKEIKSLAALKERQRALHLEMEASKQEFAQSMGQSREDLQDFLLKKVALPAGGAILGLYLLHKVLNRPSSPLQDTSPPIVEHAGAAAGANNGLKSSASVTSVSDPLKSSPPVSRPAANKSGFDFKKIISLGKIMVPAAQAIMAAINESKGQPK
ncbi:MAG: hypothetical protein AAGA31_11995 [Bacteroidota bacterium]